MSKVLSLIGTGVALGIVHVLTGPDHLSALATLSANVGSVQHAFCLGVRWGLGHSTGLLMVGTVLILLSRKSEEGTVRVPDRLTVFFESLVGIFMILLGLYGIRRASEKRPKAYGVIPTIATHAIVSTRMQQDGESYHDDLLNGDSILAVPDGTEDVFEVSRDAGGDDAGVPSRLQFLVGCATNVSTRTMAVLAGIIHGLAGPGGVLGVIPAVQLHNGRLATIYLGSFCLSSTLTMGIFATIYGTCSSRLADREEPLVAGNTLRREFWIECASASLSIVVGILWLTLLSIGKLDDVFP